MTKIYMVRHGDKLYDTQEGKDNWEVSARYKENSWDVPLSNTGKINSAKIGKELVKIGFDKEIKYLYSSPLTRCIETSIEIIKDMGQTIYDI